MSHIDNDESDSETNSNEDDEDDDTSEDDDEGEEEEDDDDQDQGTLEQMALQEQEEHVGILDAADDLVGDFGRVNLGEDGDDVDNDETNSDEDDENEQDDDEINNSYPIQLQKMDHYLQYINLLGEATIDNDFVDEELKEQLKNPPHEVIDLSEDKDMIFSLEAFIATSSREGYEKIRSAYRRRHPTSNLPSYERLKTKIKNLTGAFLTIVHVVRFSSRELSLQELHLSLARCASIRVLLSRVLSRI